MKKDYTIIIFLLGLIVMLSIGKAVFHNMLSTSGIFVSKAEQEINFYKTQNAMLSQELLTSSSLMNILGVASELGFTNKSPSFFALKTSRPLAVKQ